LSLGVPRQHFLLIPRRHAHHATEMARMIVDELLRVANSGCSAELFSYQTIDMFCREYGFDMVEW
jgi:hypothetical protein